MNVANVAEVAGGNHRARLLDHRVAAVVERHRMDDPAWTAASHSARAVAAVVASGLSGRCASGAQRGKDDSLVEVIGSRVVDHVNVGIGRHGLVTDVRTRHAQFVGFSPRRRLAARADGNHVDEAEPAHGVDVMAADEAGADQAHTDSFHVMSLG